MAMLKSLGTTSIRGTWIVIPTGSMFLSLPLVELICIPPRTLPITFPWVSPHSPIMCSSLKFVTFLDAATGTLVHLRHRYKPILMVKFSNVEHFVKREIVLLSLKSFFSIEY